MNRPDLLKTPSPYASDCWIPPFTTPKRRQLLQQVYDDNPPTSGDYFTYINSINIPDLQQLIDEVLINDYHDAEAAGCKTLQDFLCHQGDLNIFQVSQLNLLPKWARIIEKYKATTTI